VTIPLAPQKYYKKVIPVDVNEFEDRKTRSSRPIPRAVSKGTYCA